MSKELAFHPDFTFKWTIENYFSWFREKDIALSSIRFHATPMGRWKWYLSLQPEKQKIFLNKIGDDIGPEDVEIDFKFEMRVGSGVQLWSSEILNDLSEHAYFFIPNGRSPADDTLIVLCHMLCPKKVLETSCSSLTKLVADQCSFKWDFNTSDFLLSNATSVKRCAVSFASEFEIEMNAPEDSFEIEIRRTESITNDSFLTLHVTCKISLLDLNGVEQKTRNDFHLFESQATVWKFPNFFKKSEIEKDKVNFPSVFSLKFDFAVSKGKSLEKIQGYGNETAYKVESSSRIDSLSVLQSDLSCMLTSEVHSDVELQVGGKSFAAHKSLLSARSPVFCAMFVRDMLESQTGVVNINDLDTQTLKLFLEYLYTGTIISMDYENALNLLIAADKYQVLSLKDECSSFLMTCFSDENVCKILMAAELVDHRGLKSAALNYIKAHAAKILPSVQWLNCIRNNIQLATDVLCQLSTEFGQSRKLDTFTFSATPPSCFAASTDAASLSQGKDNKLLGNAKAVNKRNGSAGPSFSFLPSTSSASVIEPVPFFPTSQDTPHNAVGSVPNLSDPQKENTGHSTGVPAFGATGNTFSFSTANLDKKSFVRKSSSIAGRAARANEPKK